MAMIPSQSDPATIRTVVEPHRGSMLSVLSITGVVISIFGVSCIPGLGIVGLPFSLIAYIGARGDLRRMSRGDMDPEGRELTGAAMRIGRNGLIVAGLSFITTAVVILVLVRSVLLW